MIIVTGGAGFIGSNLILGLNAKGHEDILVVDDLTEGKKFRNLVNAEIMDYWDIDEFSLFINENKTFSKKVDAIFHQGACSTTTEWDGCYMMDNNYTYSKNLLHYCLEQDIPYIYASSAAIYGINLKFEEDEGNEFPINVYGYSKYLFDEYVRKISDDMKSQVVGLRYFNVYGPGEEHKGGMASTAFHFNNQLNENGYVKLFKGSGGYADGEQRRDFIYVEDVVDVNLWFFENNNISGIYNVGTGTSRSFNDMAKTILDWRGHGEIRYIEFPQHLENSYQSFTEANINNLRNTGYKHEFTPLEEGINKYLGWLNPDD
jgi:ADP-L-glycero-D-manno-heptose 6-epimerase